MALRQKFLASSQLELDKMARAVHSRLALLSHCLSLVWRDRDAGCKVTQIVARR